MRMNSGIILSGQQPNIMAQAQQGYALGRQNALDSLYQQHGQGIVSGDQNALNALAQFDPMAAQKVQANRQSMAQSAETHQWNAEKMQMLRDQAKAETAAQAAKMSAAEAAAANEKLTGLIQAGSMYFKNGDRAGFERFAAENGLQLRFDDLPAHLARAIGTKDALDALAPPERKTIKGADGFQYYQDTGERVLPGVEKESEKVWRDPTPEEAARGILQVNDQTGAYKMAPKGMKITSDGRGGFTLTESVGVGGDADTMGMDPTGAQAMVDSINGILNDPALDWSTGILAPLQQVPGTDQRRVGSRINQLDGQAFLRAFESLKGGGQITEIEGQKATQAIGRLDSYQKPEDYRAALTELRDLLVLGQSRPKGWVAKRDQAVPEIGTLENGYRFKGGDPASPQSWERVE